ncbi:MAG: hypothetical protein RMK74_05830 [Myxococcales bacterium]|nr:hypothetical protein [Myxococcales bacterium]
MTATGRDDASPGDLGAVRARLERDAPAVAALERIDPGLLRAVMSRPLSLDESETFLRASFAAVDDAPDERDAMRALRRARHRAVTRIVLRELYGLADIDRTAREMALVAEVAIDAALRTARRIVSSRIGEPLLGTGRPVGLVALGMGKLGGGELNLGSDVDLVFFFDAEEGGRPTYEPEVAPWASRVVQTAVRLLEEPTEDGICLRVDLRLRPEGSRGPLVGSLAAAERYYETFGRTWERAAMARARPIAGDRDVGRRLLAALEPFVWRRSVDPTIAREMVLLLQRARRESGATGDDVKLGPGGIRAIEFFVQTLQLVWGGLHPELRVPGTVEALRRLTALGLVSARESETLQTAWALLRRVEHRIHARTGVQTHRLPSDPLERDALARSLGFADGAALDQELQAHRGRVEACLASLLEHEPVPDAEIDTLAELVASGASAAELGPLAVQTLGVCDEDAAGSHLVRLARRGAAPLGPVARVRQPELGRCLLREVRESADADDALAALADFFGAVPAAAGYDRLLNERPRLLRRLVGLFGASPTLAAALVAHPEDVDLLFADEGELGAWTVRDAHAAVHEAGDDPQRFVAALRRARREVVLRAGMLAMAEGIDPEPIAARLTELAEHQVALCLDFALREEARRIGQPPVSLVVVGLGSLGGGEMGFGSDLDVLFLHDAPPQSEAAERAVRVAQRTLWLLGQPDAEGSGWDVDARLRPGGSRGWLVTSLSALVRYHAGSAAGPTAASWERMTLLRARPIAGDPALASRVRQTLESLAYDGPPPDPEPIAALRARMERELAREGPHRYHAKVGWGALADVEFIVQTLQMKWGGERAVRVARTEAALRALCEVGALDPTQTDVLLAARAFFRRVRDAIGLADASREPWLGPGPFARRVARLLGMRARDRIEPWRALFETWRGHAVQTRGLFERLVAPTGTPPPWRPT